MSTRIVMVPGHAQPVKDRSLLKTTPSEKDKKDWDAGNDWLFVGAFEGEGRLLAQHIKAAVAHANQERIDVLFSGGSTRSRLVGQLTEAEAYRSYAEAEAELDSTKTHVWLETFARDSAENLDFALARLVEEAASVGEALSKIRLTVFGWKFKQDRFEWHAAALRVWLMAKGIMLARNWFEFIGVNDPSTIPVGEAELAKKLKKDPLLVCENNKRQGRCNLARTPYRALGQELPDLDALGREEQTGLEAVQL